MGKRERERDKGVRDVFGISYPIEFNEDGLHDGDHHGSCCSVGDEHGQEHCCQHEPQHQPCSLHMEKVLYSPSSLFRRLQLSKRLLVAVVRYICF